MVQPEQPRSRAETWDDARRAATAAWPGNLTSIFGLLRGTLSRWTAAETSPGRMAPWLAVAFGFGIVLYFTAAQEPVWWVACALAVTAIAGAFAARRHIYLFPAALLFAALATGFAVVSTKTHRIVHPVLASTVGSVTLSGFVEMREERERRDRIVLRVHKMDSIRGQTLERVRISVRRGTAPPVGSFVELKARLTPPLQPLRPVGYDFARDMYFQKIGASGFVLGAIRTLDPPSPPDFRLRFAASVSGLRDTMDTRIRAVLPGDTGAIASALITGKRDAITAPVNDAMYVSSLAHVLSISGYHMAVVAGIVFFLIRALLALSPAMSDRRPIKKWAALGALAAAAFYLVLSGAEVATQRSFIMIAIVLIGVMVDRPAFTLRTLTVAALAVMALTPEAVVHPSFQMSFAATLALVAGYQYGLPWKATADTSAGARIALWGGREVVGLILASVVAGLATTLYAAFHFHRLAPYGVIANLGAMPVVSAFVMPMGILGAMAMPFGFDGIFWQLMGYGIDWMVRVALWVASLPGAVGRIHAFGIAPLLLGTLGLILICLLRSPLRWSGALIAAIAIVMVIATSRPDIFIAPDGQAMAVRGTGGRLAAARSGSDTFALKEWLAADGDERAANDKSLAEGLRCDGAGCTLPLANGKLAAFATTIEAFEDDCLRAQLVVSPREAQIACAATLVDRKVWRQRGALAMQQTENGFTSQAARPPGYRRPWTPQMADADDVVPSTPVRPVSRDATPRAEDLEAGD
jgi:competence protein ComEC